MKPEAQLLINCPKCNSGKLMFERNDDKHVRLVCMDCKYSAGGFRDKSLDAAEDWNNSCSKIEQIK